MSLGTKLVRLVGGSEMNIHDADMKLLKLGKVKFELPSILNLNSLDRQAL